MLSFNELYCKLRHEVRSLRLKTTVVSFEMIAFSVPVGK